MSEMRPSNGKTIKPMIQTDQTEGKKFVHASIRLLIPPDKWQEALAILGSVIELIRFEEGCMSCRLYQDLHEEGALMLTQIWENHDSLERHLRSDRFRTVLLVVEMATEYPEVRFDVIASTSGMETIQKVRV